VLRRLFVTTALLTALAGCAGTAAGTGAESAGGTTSAAPTQLSLPATAAEGAASEAVGTSAGGPSDEQATGSTDDGGASGEAPEPDPTAQPVLLLEAGGLGVVLDDTRIEHLPFGTAATTVRGAVARLVGPLATKRRTDCKQGLRTSSTAGGLELLFRGTRFVGWTDTGRPGRPLTTGDGIGVGITVAALEDSGTDVTLDPLPGGGGEWTSGPGGLYGRSTSVAATGRVTLVSSGETCLPD
jgi:hypothetical protein